MLKLGRMHRQTGERSVDPTAMSRQMTNEKGLRLLEFATFNSLLLTNTLNPHKPSRRWTWHSPDEKHHNQIDYILVKKRFRSGVNIRKTRSFPEADIGSDHDQMIMTLLGKERHRKNPWITKDVLDLYDERRGLKKKRYEAEGAKAYREANRRIHAFLKKW